MADNKTGALYQWIKGNPPKEDIGVEQHEGWTLDDNKVVEESARLWNKLWNPETHGGQDKWINRSFVNIPRKLKGKELELIAKRLKKTTAGGPDGWRAEELKLLPSWIWDWAAAD